jgi:hypothetical protein
MQDTGTVGGEQPQLRGTTTGTNSAEAVSGMGRLLRYPVSERIDCVSPVARGVVSKIMARSMLLSMQSRNSATGWALPVADSLRTRPAQGHNRFQEY